MSPKRSEEPIQGDRDRAAGWTRLPAGRHGLPREFVARNQRERILTAMVDSVAERGYNATTVADITKAASVSRRTFYEHFADKEACFLAAYETVAEHIGSSMRSAAESFDEWPQQVRAALATLLRFLSAEPELARVCLIEPIAAGGEVAARHQASIRALAEAVRESRPRRDGPSVLPGATEEAMLGGIAALIVREISAGRAGELEALLPDMVELALAPYLGEAEAERLARQGGGEATGGQDGEERTRARGAAAAAEPTGGERPRVTLSGDLEGAYLVEEVRADGSLVLVPEG